MCGITGYAFVGRPPVEASAWLRDSVAALNHRGPDDKGIWEEGSVGLGHARLSILDLSPLGHQPMLSTDEKWAMVFNGEVYNFRLIRAELEQLGHRFRGTGDSEVILAAFAQWGPLDAVNRFVGMFAIALCHRPSGRLFLIRDRFGVKPLYYAWDGKALWFGSELKAVRSFTGRNFEIDPMAVADFFHYGYITAPRTIYAGVFKVPQAHVLELSAQGEVQIHRYWSAADHLGKRKHQGESDLADELEALMIDAFKYRMISDVPVGVFLSGGVDSSVVAALLQAHGGAQIKTFTIGFNEPRFDESEHAKRVADHLGTDHHSRILQTEDAKRLFPTWGDLFDEPFADASGIPTLMVSRVASEHVKVVLSADGGDELFSGYNTYGTALRRYRWLQTMPGLLKHATAGATSALQSASLDDWLADQSWLGGRGHDLRNRTLGKLRKINERIQAKTIGEVFDQGHNFFRAEELRRMGVQSAPTRPLADVYPGEPGEKIGLWDLHNYMSEDVLTKVDRATMAVSIEGREPLIDHRLAEFAMSIPFSMKQGPLGSKHLLRRVLHRYVPQALVDRPKQGFGLPIHQWLRKDLSHLLDEHLSEQAISAHGLFDARAARQYVTRYRRGDHTVAQRVWLMTAFQMWHRRWMQ